MRRRACAKIHDAQLKGDRQADKQARACLELNETLTLTTHAMCLAGTLFLLTGYSGYLGWQWRSVRTIAQEIRCASRRGFKRKRQREGAVDILG